MPSPASRDVTRLLQVLRAHPEAPADTRQALYHHVYAELHRLARYHRSRWNGNDTLNTTALVHEAYLKLAGGEGDYASRGHFMAVASKAIRQVLYSYAERQSAQKRGGDVAVVSLDEAAIVPPERAEALVALEEALARLERVDPRAAQVVECRFFGGLDAEETADALGISARTVGRDWAMARAWLFGELTRDALEPAP